jgi:poly(3-hydroxybutyrate) depolymerase
VSVTHRYNRGPVWDRSPPGLAWRNAPTFLESLFCYDIPRICHFACSRTGSAGLPCRFRPQKGCAMRRRKTIWLSVWNAFSRTAARNSKQVRKTVSKAAFAHAADVSKVARRVRSGVVSPAPALGARGRGRWEQGRWGLGPLVLRDYRLFIPPGVSASRPAPLLVLLHGCGQDSASFAASTRVAAIARAERCVVLLPEQCSLANAQRCWNWFRAEARVAAEAMLLMAIIEHVSMLYPVRRDRVFALGISAGGAMALTVALRFPERFAAVGTHSGPVPHSAVNALQVVPAMHGHRAPDKEALRLRLAGRRLPPLLVLHGDADHVVLFDNAWASARLWLDLLPQGHALTCRTREVQRGARRPHSISDWKLAAQPYVRLVRIAGLGHAWSGGAPKQAFSDPSGPDALKIALRFFADSTSIGRATRLTR